MRTDTSTLTADDIRRAYVHSDLRRVGVSFQKALAQDSTRIALRVLAAAMRKTEHQKDGKPAPIRRAQISEAA